MKGVRRATRVVGTTIVGSVLLVAGLVMLVTPGPGLVAIAGGLAVLAREFTWARRLLERVRIRLTRPRFRRHEHAARVEAPVGSPRPEDLPLAPYGQRHVA